MMRQDQNLLKNFAKGQRVENRTQCFCFPEIVKCINNEKVGHMQYIKQI